MPLAQGFSNSASAEQRTTSTLLLLLGASVAIIGVALGFEHIGKYRPCPLCLVERYAYYFAIVATAAGLVAAWAGLGVSWRHRNFNLSGTWAHGLGSNPGRSVFGGTNVDGRTDRQQFWLSGSLSF